MRNEKGQFIKGHQQWLGKNRSNDTKIKISKSHKGKKLSEETKRKISENNVKFFLGKHLSKKHKRNLSKSHKDYFIDGGVHGMKGKHHSSETKIKISNGNKGKIVSDETKNKISKAGKGKHKHWLGKHLSVETKRKISEAHKGKHSGNRCNFWKGGVSSENERIRHGIEIRLWRESVFARDNWTCQNTGEKGGIIQSHHIYNFADYPALRTSIDNGITLSKKSHQEFHKIYGRKNNTREQLEEFLKN